jgi:uncharacterized protein (TIGR02271 family)
MFDRSSLEVGDQVFSSDRHKIGNITSIDDEHMHVQTGFLGLGQALIIPFSAVSQVADRNIYLSYTRDELTRHSGEWSSAAAAAGAHAAPPAPAPPAAPAAQRETTPAAYPERRTTLAPSEIVGKKLCASDGKEVGSIVDSGVNYLTVKTGVAGLGQQLFVPPTAMTGCNTDCCYLNVPYDRVSSMGWERQPQRAAAAGGREAMHEYRIPLIEEELEVHRHRERVGEVVISKDVVEEQRTINVPVSHEEVRIERHAVDRPVDANTPPFGREESEIRVPIYEEEVDVEKRARVREEIVVTPEETTREQRVSEKVRREVPRVNTSGDVGDVVHGEETIEGQRDREYREGETKP